MYKNTAVRKQKKQSASVAMLTAVMILNFERDRTNNIRSGTLLISGCHKMHHVSLSGSILSYYQKQKEVSFYSNQMNLTAKHLSCILKEETGLSAKQSINEFILFEAKSLLKQTGMSIVKSRHY